MPKGKAQRLTPEQIAAAAEITPEDIEAARKAWERDAPPRYKKLLDAQPEQSQQFKSTLPRRRTP